MMLNPKSKIAGQWIDFRSKKIVSRIFGLERKKDKKVKIKNRSSTGHERKLVAEVEGEKYVIRISLSNDFAWENKVHQVCRREEAPVAPVVECGIQWRGLIPVKYLVLEYLPGESCNESSKISLVQVSKIGKAFGKIHSIDERYFEGNKRKSELSNVSETKEKLKKYMRYAIKNIDSDEKVSRRTLEWIKSEVKILSEKKLIGMTHGDPHGSNIVKKGKKIFLIDTDSMAFGFTPFEFVQCLLASYNDFDLGRQQAFMQGYREEAGRGLLEAWEKNKKFLSAAVLLKVTWERLKFAESTHSDRRFKRAVSFWKSFLEISSQKTDIRSIGDVNYIVKSEIKSNEKL